MKYLYIRSHFCRWLFVIFLCFHAMLVRISCIKLILKTFAELKLNDDYFRWHENATMFVTHSH